MGDTVTFEQFRDVWLTDVREGSPTTTQLGNRFAHKLLTQWLDIGEGSDDPVYCDGAGDGGIDVAFLDRKESAGSDSEQAVGDTWYLVQSKYGSAFQGTKTLLEEGQKVVDSLDGKRTNLSSLAAGLLGQLKTFRDSASDRDRIVLVFGTEEPLTDAQKRALEDVRNIGRGRIGTLFDVDSVSLDTIFKSSLDEPIVDAPRTKVQLTAKLVPSGPDLLVGSTPLIGLFEFLKLYKKATLDLDQLYERNVRRFLGGRGKVNKNMAATLQNEPEHFGLFNNGITITVADFVPTDGGYELVDPYVVNGCQTTRTIWDVCQQKLAAIGTGKLSADLESWRSRLSQGVVVTKVVRIGSKGEEMLEKITRYTNTQNGVKEKDFLTLKKDFRDWSEGMAKTHNVFLEVQRGGWDSQRALQKQRPTLRKFDDSANAFDLLKVYGSGWLREAGIAFRQNASFLPPNGTVFQKIMEPTEDSSFGVDDLYAAYRLRRAADGFKFGRAASADKPGRRQTRFLFYLVATDLVRDVMNRAKMKTTPKMVTQAWARLFQKGNEEACRVLLDNAVSVIDEYMNAEMTDSFENEPAFGSTGRDLNAFLKSEGLGKVDGTTPHLLALIGSYGKLMGMAPGTEGHKSVRDQITAAIKPAASA